MRAFRIPAALAVVASLALVGCGDLGTAPSVDELGPQFRAGPPSQCPRGFTALTLAEANAESGVLNDPNLVNGNGDDTVCLGTVAGVKVFTDNNAPRH